MLAVKLSNTFGRLERLAAGLTCCLADIVLACGRIGSGTSARDGEDGRGEQTSAEKNGTADADAGSS